MCTGLWLKNMTNGCKSEHFLYLIIITIANFKLSDFLYLNSHSECSLTDRKCYHTETGEMHWSRSSNMWGVFLSSTAATTKMLIWVEQSRNPIHHFLMEILITELLQGDRNTVNSRVQYFLMAQVLLKNMGSS